MAAWRMKEVDAAERGNETGKVVIAHGSVVPAQRHQLA